MQCLQYTAAFCLKLVGCFGISYIIDSPADDSRQIDVMFGSDLACHNHLPCGNHRLTGYMGIGIKSKEIVKNSVANLVSDFVWVSLGHRFGGK